MAHVGRLLLIKKNAVAIAAVTEKSVSINHEPIDITSDDDDGWRKLLGTVATRSVDLSVSGVAGDTTLRTIAAGTGSQLLTDITLEWPNGDVLSGDFYMSSYEESGSTADKITFSAKFQSSGLITFTPD